MSLLKVIPEALSNLREIEVPFLSEVLKDLRAGEMVGLTGYLYTGRDQTHRRLCDLLAQGKQLPVEMRGQLLYYVGPTPAKPGQIQGIQERSL